MKIITWNCNGAFRNKYENLSAFSADIYVIQECEDPARANNEGYSKWRQNHLWIGDNKNKGLGIFAKDDIDLTPLNWPNQYQDHIVKYFLPCRINQEFNLLAVWAHYNNSPTFGYIGQFWKYLQVNKSRFEDIIILGDLNSNKIWDKWDRWWNHSNVIEQLEETGIESLYHHFNQELQGEETLPTFFLQRNKRKTYHIDYVFASNNLKESLEKIEIGKIERWLALSDHLPIISCFDL